MSAPSDGAKKPAVQLPHSVAAGVATAVPALQAAHERPPKLGWKKPGEQAVHAARPPVDATLPGMHCEQEIGPIVSAGALVLTVPASQRKQAVNPVLFAKKPESHGKQLAWPCDAAYVPALQRGHWS